MFLFIYLFLVKRGDVEINEPRNPICKNYSELWPIKKYRDTAPTSARPLQEYLPEAHEGCCEGSVDREGACLCCHEEEKVWIAEATQLTYLKNPCPEPVTEIIRRSIANCRHRASPKAHLSRAVKSFAADAGRKTR